MGFLQRLFGFGTRKSKEKKKKRNFRGRQADPDTTQTTSVFIDAASSADGLDSNKHAIAVAAATAAVAEAALAAAHAAAEVVRLTSAGSTRSPSAIHVTGAQRRWTEELAAVKIQSAFRAYLARRALKALKALVKLQALVRGHMVRKQTADMLRRMQTLVRVQARARASRTHLSQSLHSSSRSSHLYHRVPASPDLSEHQLRASSTKFDGSSILKRCGSNSNLRDIINLDRSHGGPNWLDRWMEENLWNNHRDISSRNGDLDDEKGDKILEVDTWKPHLKSQLSNRRFQASQRGFSSDLNKDSVMIYNSPPKHPTKAPKPISAQATQSSRELSSLGSLGKDEAGVRTVENSPREYLATSVPGSCSRRTPLTPTRSECAWGSFSGYVGHPNYMSNTESSRAKVRSQSAPRQRLEFENFGSIRRSLGGFADAGANSERDLPTQAEYINKAHSASSRLNRLWSSHLR